MKQKTIDLTKTFILNEEGQAMVEYALIIALMAVAILAALLAFSSTVKEMLYDNIIDKIEDVISFGRDSVEDEP